MHFSTHKITVQFEIIKEKTVVSQGLLVAISIVLDVGIHLILLVAKRQK